MAIELNDRKKLILEAIVSDYVDTAEPVGSITLTHHHLRKVSPATVRAEMAELERIGLLTHPHTSAGRIPTDLGYRYYVDHIMETKTVSGREIALIKSGFRNIGRGIEEILRGTAKILSSVLNYVTIFAVFGQEQRKIITSGISNVLRQPEFTEVSQARNFIETIEQEDFLSRILEGYARRQSLNIHIGHENPYRQVQDFSVAVIKCQTLGLNPGAIGILGPTRMNYDHVTSVLNYVTEEFNRLGQEVIHVRRT